MDGAHDQDDHGRDDLNHPEPGVGVVQELGVLPDGLLGFQAEGAAPIVHGHIVKEPKTIASAIRIGNPASWQKAVAARDESGGTIDMVSDQEIMTAHRLMATKGGIFCEPASAAPLAGLLKLVRNGMDFAGKRVVCVVTGNGLKDTDIVLKNAEPFLNLPADLAAVERALGWSGKAKK